LGCCIRARLHQLAVSVSDVLHLIALLSLVIWPGIPVLMRIYEDLRSVTGKSIEIYTSKCYNISVYIWHFCLTITEQPFLDNKEA